MRARKRVINGRGGEKRICHVGPKDDNELKNRNKITKVKNRENHQTINCTQKKHQKNEKKKGLIITKMNTNNTHDREECTRNYKPTDIIKQEKQLFKKSNEI